MAIFQKTEPGLLYELSPGRDGRLLVWSTGLMKYQYCTTLEDLSDVNSNYLEQDIDDGCWFYQLPRLVNGDNMFYNDTMTELYEGRVPLWHFESNLQSLQSGVNMFKGCSLDVASVKRIADTLSDKAPGTITLGIHYSLEGDSNVEASLAKIENKGWSVEVEYNLPYGFTELEYLESPTTVDTNVAAYFALPINNKPGRDTLRIVSEHYFPSLPSVVSMEGIGHNLCAFHTLCYSITSKRFFFSYDGSKPHPLADINLYYTFPVGEWATYETFRGAEEVYFSVNGSVAVRNTVEWSEEALENTVMGCFGRIAGDYTYTAFGQYGRKKSWKLYHNSALLYDLRPVLDAEGTPCMFDRVSRTCFYNQGVGTFGYRVKRTGEEVNPAGITALEYLEASGTQYIDTGVLPDTRLRVELTGATLVQKTMCFIGAHSGAGYNTQVQIFSDSTPHVKTYQVNTQSRTLNIPAESMSTSVLDLSRGLVSDSGSMVELPVSGAMPTVPFYLFAQNSDAAMETEYNLVGKIRRCRIFRDGDEEPVADFVPVLDDSGKPCMYDNMSGSYHRNVGSGSFGYRVLHQETEVEPTTFSLRDPYYVAPSGVYARLVAENELDIVADTDMTADIAEQEGYIWFANTGEAYDHFDITQQPEEEEIIEA